MRAVIQRVSYGSVRVDEELIGEIGRGVVVLVGVRDGDAESDAAWLASKTANLRIFPDDEGKFDRSLLDVRGEALVVSQFTLYGDARRGRRPSFSHAAAPQVAEPLIEAYCQQLREEGIPRIETGRFGAMMHVEIHNDGPVTLLLDTEISRRGNLRR
jgi:D-tyrosyl-tRNA(Tyr) deacylase